MLDTGTHEASSFIQTIDKVACLWDGIYFKRETKKESIFNKDEIIIEPKVHGDARGYFVEEFLGYKINFCQDNESKGGLAPFAQTKLVRTCCSRY